MGRDGREGGNPGGALGFRGVGDPRALKLRPKGHGEAECDAKHEGRGREREEGGACVGDRTRLSGAGIQVPIECARPIERDSGRGCGVPSGVHRGEQAQGVGRHQSHCRGGLSVVAGRQRRAQRGASRLGDRLELVANGVDASGERDEDGIDTAGRVKSVARPRDVAERIQ